MPLRSAETELRNTIDLQHTTVEHIALMQQFQCTKCRNTCKKKRTASTKKRKSHLEPSVPQRAQIEYASTAKRGSPHPSQQSSLLFFRNGTSAYPKKHKCFVQVLMLKSLPWCVSSNAILPAVTCKTQSDSQDSTAEELLFEKRWRSHFIAICTDRVAKHNCNTLL